nr:zinc finger, CCHC-type [Tanacetum cinerariifolium]
MVPLRSHTIWLGKDAPAFILIFPYNQDSNWLERLLAGSISIWEDLATRFLAQFFPPRRTTKLRNDILIFQQHQGESLSEAWTRFKDLLQKVPYHGIDLWLKVQIFYDHVNPATRRTIDQSAGGKLRNRDAKESWALLEDLSIYDNDKEFVVGSMSVTKIIDPKVRLAHRCISTTISSRKELTQRITTIDMFYLYCIYAEGVVCHISYWLARYLRRAKDMNVLCGGMFVTRISWSFVLLSREMVDALSVEPRARTFIKKSLITMGIIMELDLGTCCWPTVQGTGEDDEIEEEADDHARAY